MLWSVCKSLSELHVKIYIALRENIYCKHLVIFAV